MTPKDFLTNFKSAAIDTEKKHGISYLAILAQAALESGWGRAAPGYNFFGIKDTDGVNGNEQLIQTTEYSSRYDTVFPQILSITPVVIRGRKMFKYKIKDYFREYKTPQESFDDHAMFLLNNPRYLEAIKYKSDPNRFVEEVAKAGYATDPLYAETLKKIIRMLQKIDV